MATQLIPSAVTNLRTPIAVLLTQVLIHPVVFLFMNFHIGTVP